MNAVPPKNQMPTKGAPADDHIHLTMSFEDDEAVATDAGAADGERTAAPAVEPEGAARGAGPRARGAADDSSQSGADRVAQGGRSGILPRFAGIELQLSVEVGSLSIALKDLISVEPGQLLALDRMTTEPVSVLVNGKPFARGEIVAVGDRYGVRLLEILSPTGGDG
jgi:flagellar motor switch protein FliN/FliY